MKVSQHGRAQQSQRTGQRSGSSSTKTISPVTDRLIDQVNYRAGVGNVKDRAGRIDRLKNRGDRPTYSTELTRTQNPLPKPCHGQLR
jgi:hypothetical protein